MRTVARPESAQRHLHHAVADLQRALRIFNQIAGRGFLGRDMPVQPQMGGRRPARQLPKPHDEAPPLAAPSRLSARFTLITATPGSSTETRLVACGGSGPRGLAWTGTATSGSKRPSQTAPTQRYPPSPGWSAKTGK